MKRAVSIFLILVFVFSLVSCGDKIVQDESPITMFIPLGNGEQYYRTLAGLIESELGYKVKFVYQISGDTTSMTRLYFKNNDLPADIVFTASKTDDSYLKDSCLDLLSRSSVTSAYTQLTVQSCTTPDGEIFQLPVSSKLIGITYNETLMKEMGWEVPKTFDDMVALKAKCDEKGITFAICDGCATGHGFNWLFHLMGSEWLSTPEGTDWFNGFQAGTRSIDEFKEKCEYFKKWSEAGLWGEFNNKEWNGSTIFKTRRALFWYGITNTADSYSGPMLDENGKETSVMLNDTFKSMPWISEDGTNNSYTYYDCCWVYVNKKLEAPEKSEKLKKVLKIIEFMATDKATKLVTESGKDTYVSVSSYNMSNDRLYSTFVDEIKSGFIQPWYYNEFDVDSIVFTGEKLNSYISGNKSDYDAIFEQLDQNNKKNLESKINVLANFPDGLGYEDTARLVAFSSIEALNMSLEASGKSERATAAIVPYTKKANQLCPWKPGSVSNSIVYKGDFDAAMILALVPQSATDVIGIYMTGKEINDLIYNGYDPSVLYSDIAEYSVPYDKNCGPYPYVCVLTDGGKPEDGKEYLVALNQRYISPKQLEKFKESGKVADNFSTVYTISDGIKKYTSEHPTITSETLK